MIKSVSAINFQSWESLSFTFEDGVTLINGYNYDDATSEGSGKSAILNALCWCLYGKLPKEAKIDEVVKDGAKNCSVTVSIGIAKVVRSRNPNDLFILDSYGVTIKGRDSRETQQCIEKMINLSFDAFCQTIYFPQNFPKKFVTSNQEDRGRILSEIQELEIFDKARKETVIMIKTEEAKVKDLEHNIEIQVLHYNNNIERIEELKKADEQQKAQIKAQIQQQENLKIEKINKIHELGRDIDSALNTKDKKQELENDIVFLNERVNVLRIEKSKYKGQLDGVHSVTRKRELLERSVSFTKNKVTRFLGEAKELQRFIDNPTKSCPTCGTELEKCDTTHAYNEQCRVKDQIELLGNEVRSLQDELNTVSDVEVTSINQIMHDLDNSLVKTSTIIYNINEQLRNMEKVDIIAQTKKDSIVMIIKDIENIDVNIDNLNNQKINDNGDLIRIAEDENRLSQEQIDSISNLLTGAKLRISRLTILKDGFREVKSYTFSSVLNELTRKANNYLIELFEMPISLRFTNENMKIGLDIRASGVERGYGLFSGGQQRRIGLAVDLALSDIVTSRTGTGVNLLILDEYFKDLSESSMEKCLTLLEKLGRPTVLIEHNSIFKSIVDRTFDIEYKDGTSKVA